MSRRDGLNLIREMEKEGLVKFLPISELPVGTLDAVLLFNSRMSEIIKSPWRGPVRNWVAPMQDDDGRIRVTFDAEIVTVLRL